MAVKRAQAYCAVGPEGLIDIDMIRRSTASCQFAASNIKGTAWPKLARQGWEVVPVRITAEDDVEGDRPRPPQMVSIEREPPARSARSAVRPDRSPGGASTKISLFRCDK